MRKKASGVRQSIIAGQWYPGHPSSLRQTIDDFLNNVELQPAKGKLMGLIVPHAGYSYSGQVAAYAYKQLQYNMRPFDLVVVISPLHRMPLGEFAITQATHYETPLGLVPLDTEAVDDLDKAVSLNRTRFDDEHSLEIQLPFLQVVLGEFKLLPVMMGSQDIASCQKLAVALSDLLGNRSTLMVASTDLSHFYAYDRAVQIDQDTLAYIANLDPEGLAQALQTHKAEACGGGPVVTTLLAARTLGADRVQVLKYANSGDVTGDRRGVVGYAAGAIYQERV